MLGPVAPAAHAEVGICLLDASGSILDLDESFVRLTQLPTPAALRGQLLTQVLAGAPALPGDSPTHTRIREHEQQVELRCQRCTAGPVAYTITALRLPGESVLAQQLRVARQTLDSVIDASPLAILTVGRDQRVVMWNPAAERIFGWTQAEILGQPYPLVPSAERPKFERLFQQVVLDGQGFTGVEATRARKDGSLIELRMHTAPLRDALGQVSGGMAMLEDLTEKRQLEEQIRHSQKMEAVGRLAGGIAHDFNNLLTAVLGNGELLELEPELSAGARERVTAITEVARSARELVAQLMTFSRRGVTRPEVVDLNARIRDAGRMLDRLLGDPIELQISTSPQPVPVRIDPAQLDRVLINLAVNAADAMPEGGVFRVETRVVVKAGQSWVCVEARDTGAGISAELLPHVFEPFFTTKPEGQGTGLGLANVYGIVHQAGGEVSVSSEAGAGARFRVFLPLARQPARQAAGLAASLAESRAGRPSVSPIPRARPGEGILLVEDNDAVRKSTARILETLGYTVETASDGLEALARWDTLTVDLVLTDLSMPRLSGAELALRLRARTPGLPIVFMSGDLNIAQLREQVEQGHARFLQKPVSLRELAQATRDGLDRAPSPR
jgi:two-component system, cell cycle sensor histidine kinase and response regulator CckA